MKRLFWLILSLVVILFLGWQTWRYFTAPVNPQNHSSQQIIIKPDSSVQQIAQILANHHLIRSPLVFRLIVRQLKLDHQLQAGLFHLSPSQTPIEIAQALTKGQLDIWVTIPEGFRNEQIAEVLAKKLPQFNQTQFLALAKPNLGKLFPDTYLIPRQATPTQIIKIFLQNYHRKLAPYQSQLQSSALTENQILTLASIVERETLSSQEKPLVAGILLKRLNHHWPLQVDATIQYILGKPGNWWPTITLADRKRKSPYNTYLNPGLPPTPIANPGLASIKAVLFPQTSPYWFYLHDKSGKIHYAKTNQEHQQNIQKYINH